MNVFCLGVLPVERLVLGRASGVGNLAVLFGSTTGRDGIGGVSVLASAGFSDDEADAAKRPSVQVGDPFEEKRLIEACLEMLDANLVVGIQDLGGAGLTCATSETASRGGVGMDVYVSEVPQRETGMEPFEVLTSESQERMLAIVEPEHLDAVIGICARWEITAAVVGTVTGDGRLRVLDRPDGDVLAELPAASLHEDAPLLDRPRAEPADRSARLADSADAALPAPGDPGADLVDMLCDTSWVSGQYDSQLFLNTVEGPGGDATVLRLKHPVTGADTGRGLALTCDGNHRWCALDPRQGTALVVAEAVANLACVGARPAGAGRLPQLRQPHPSRDDVAAVRGHRRHGRRLPGAGPAGGGRQRQPLQRVARARHRPHPGGGGGGHDRPAGGAAAGRRPGGRDPRRGRGGGRRSRRPVGLALGLAPGPQGGHAPGARPGRPPAGVRRRAGPGDRRPGAGRARRRRRWPRPRRWPRWPWPAAWAPASRRRRTRPTPGCSASRASRFVLAVDPAAEAEVGRRLQAAGVTWTVVGEAGGDRLVVEGPPSVALDVDLADATAAWRGRLPDLLGQGTTQG